MTQHQAPEVTSELREQLALFVRESNWIEGIRRDPTDAEIDAHAVFLSLPKITLDALVDLVAVLQPDARLRDRAGLNVYVGEHVPPPGGLAIPLALYDLLERVGDPYLTHAEYETLHPFTDGNGRSGRALWLWTMGGNAPLGFLHHWYYQSLAGNGFRGKADTRATQPLSLTVDDETVERLRDALDFDAQAGTDAQWSRLMAEAHNALDRLQSLSLPVDIDRSGLAQEVE